MDGVSEEIDLYGQLRIYFYDPVYTHNFAEVLEIERGATKTEIKKAYHKVRPCILPCDQDLIRPGSAIEPS